LLPSLPTLECSMVDMAKRTFQKFFSLLIFRILFLSVFNTTFVYTFLNLLFICIAQLQLCYRVPLPHKLTSKHQNIFGFPYCQWQCDKAQSTTQLRNNCTRLKYKYYFWKRLSQWQASPMLGSKRQWRYGTVCVLTRPRRWGSFPATSKRLFLL
jgi:hypothetical protein